MKVNKAVSIKLINICKERNISINKLGFNTTENSIKVNVNATVGDNPIVNYIYKIDDNSEIINDTSSYLFQNNLSLCDDEHIKEGYTKIEKNGHCF